MYFQFLSGDVIVADTGNNRVLVINPEKGDIIRVIGSLDGRAGSPKSFEGESFGSDLLNAPMGLAVTLVLSLSFTAF